MTKPESHHPLNANHIAISEDWTAHEALAIFDFLVEMEQRIWAQYEDEILPLIIPEIYDPPHDLQEDNHNNMLDDLDDEIPF